MDEDDQNDEYIQELDDNDDDEYNDDEALDEVNENDMGMNKPGYGAPYQIIGNQYINYKGRPQSAKVTANNFSNARHNFYPKKDDNSGQNPMKAYQNNYQGDALNIVRNYGGGNKAKRPMSASHMGRSGRNGSTEQVIASTLTAQNSKMPTEISYMDIKRMKPRRINQEKERLYEQVIKLKVQMNSFKSENLKLRTQLKFMEKEEYAKEGIIENLASNNEVTTIGRLGNIINNKKMTESYLTTALKRQVKDLKQLIKEREDEIISYKKNFKSTKINELDIELRSYMDECLRLRHLLEDTVKSKDPLTDPDQVNKIEEQFQQQNDIINSMQNENQDLREILNQKESETLEWRNLVEEYQKRINRLRPAAKDNKKLRKMNKEKKNELQKIRQELLLLRSKTSPEVKVKVDEMMRKQDDLAGKVGNNKMKIVTLKKDKTKLQEQKKELLDKFEELENERDQLAQEVEEEANLKRKFEELYSEEREKNLALRKYLDELDKDDKKHIPRNQSARPKSASKYGRKNDSQNDTKNDQDKIDEVQEEFTGTKDQFGSDASEEKEILLNKIIFSDIEAIAIELRDTFKIRRIPFHKIKNEFPNEPITLTEFKDILMTQYNLEETDALMTARYIFEEDEDEGDEKVMFDEMKQLEHEHLVDSIQRFIRLNETVDAYRLSENHQESDRIEESIPNQSIEVEQYNRKRQDQEPDDEIEDNYSDAIDESVHEEVEEEVKPTKDSPKIEEEKPKRREIRSEPDQDQQSESEIDEDKGLTIAENCFNKMADAMKARNTTTIDHFKDYIGSQVVDTDDGQKFEIVYIHPESFLEGIEALGLDLSDEEIKCLMIILVKPELDNIILVQDL